MGLGDNTTYDFRLYKIDTVSDLNSLNLILEQAPLIEFTGISEPYLEYPDKLEQLNKGSFYVWFVKKSVGTRWSFPPTFMSLFLAGSNDLPTGTDCVECIKTCTNGGCVTNGSVCYCYGPLPPDIPPPIELK